jgi:hypothetical protein
MKQLFKCLIICLFLINLPGLLLAQDSREAEIRQLEKLESDATLKGDSALLFHKLWSPKLIMNSPFNKVVNISAAQKALRSGGLSYASYERNIEKVAVDENVAIVMGEEKIKPQEGKMNAGKVLTTRFTHVWLYANNNWSLVGRQSTIIKVE